MGVTMGLPLSGTAAMGAAMQVGTRSVLNPLLWLCGIVTPVSMAAALMASGPLVGLFAVLAVAPPVVALCSYVYFMFKDPDRLQSEPFRIEQQVVQAQIGDNRTNQFIEIPYNQMSLSANSAAKEVASE